MLEWLSMALLLPLVLHVWKNWGFLVRYLGRGTMLGPGLLACLAAEAAFALPAMTAQAARRRRSARCGS